MHRKTFLQKAGLVLISVLLSLFIAELVLRMVFKPQLLYYVWQPYLHHVFHPDSSFMPGVNGAKEFSINASGVRGDGFEKGKPNTLFIGGSTTECLYLDNSETWWHLWAQERRRSNPADENFGSVGKSGCTSIENYLQLKYIVPQLKYVNRVVLMIGINDLMVYLSHDCKNATTLNKAVEDSLVNTIFLKKGRDIETGWWRRTALFYVLRNFYEGLTPKGISWQHVQDDNGAAYNTWRRYRHNADHLIDTLPDITSALGFYRTNLELICAEAKRQHLQLVFITQPCIYRDTANASIDSLLWMGGIGDFQAGKARVYYTQRVLGEALALYNKETIAFCNENHVQCIDAASVLPKDTSVFYDDCHFNESGARKLANYLSSVQLQPAQ
ncbi:MAG TPA: GDSL-type esterase/lipase family protein [Chitinophagales bacterium]|nr:GDSL-type esterase/lipase family protein [Chitinophagales bacterium]